VTIDESRPNTGHLKLVRHGGGIVSEGRVHEIISAKVVAAYKRNRRGQPAADHAIDLIAVENPARSFADFVFDIPAEGPVALSVLDAVGRPVADLTRNGHFGRGEHVVRWKPDPALPSGIYTVLLRFAGWARSLQVSYVK
jgi:hypothetical protein